MLDRTVANPSTSPGILDLAASVSAVSESGGAGAGWSRSAEGLFRTGAVLAVVVGLVDAVNGLTRHDGQAVVGITDAAWPPIEASEHLDGPFARVWSSDLSRIDASLSRVDRWGTLLLVAVLLALIARHCRVTTSRVTTWARVPGPSLTAAIALTPVLAVAPMWFQHVAAEVVLADLGSPPGYVPHTWVRWGWLVVGAALLVVRAVARRRGDVSHNRPAAPGARLH